MAEPYQQPEASADPRAGRSSSKAIAKSASADFLLAVAVVISLELAQEHRFMATRELHRGRLIDHLQLVVNDLAASKRFYTAVFEVIGIPLAGEGEDYFWADELFISTRESAAAQGKLTGRTHLAFQGKSREMVENFHEAALAAGGRDNGPPGERSYHPGYFGAFVIDPDGHNIEVVFHGPAEKSAESVKITFAA
jgi:catechol 2,3-dioxygenase-like lactoylglutathione lyase family enzyme